MPVPVYSTRFRKSELAQLMPVVDASFQRFPELDGFSFPKRSYPEVQPGEVYVSRLPLDHEYDGFADEPHGKIRLKPAKVLHGLVGHELCHLIKENPDCGGVITSGETGCDIWAIARDRIFADRFPVYLMFEAIYSKLRYCGLSGEEKDSIYRDRHKKYSQCWSEDLDFRNRKLSIVEATMEWCRRVVKLSEAGSKDPVRGCMPELAEMLEMRAQRV
jgi:hypothetical protein